MTPKKKTITVGGKTLNLQHPGIRWAVATGDNCSSASGRLLKEKYIDELLKGVVIDDISMDDFDTLDDMNEAVSAIEEFVRYGK